jgi:hypothetical protein
MDDFDGPTLALPGPRNCTRFRPAPLSQPVPIRRASIERLTAEILLFNTTLSGHATCYRAQELFFEAVDPSTEPLGLIHRTSMRSGAREMAVVLPVVVLLGPAGWSRLKLV